MTELKNLSSVCKTKFNHTEAIYRSASLGIISTLARVSASTLFELWSRIKTLTVLDIPTLVEQANKAAKRFETEKSKDEPFLLMEVRYVAKQLLHRDYWNHADIVWRQSDQVKTSMIINQTKLGLKFLPNGAKTKCGWGYFVRVDDEESESTQEDDKKSSDQEEQESARQQQQQAPSQEKIFSSSDDDEPPAKVPKQKISKEKVKATKSNNARYDRKIQELRNKWVANSYNSLNERLQNYAAKDKQ